MMTCGECGEPTLSIEVDMLDDPNNLYLFCLSCTARIPVPTHMDDSTVPMPKSSS